MLGGGGNSFGGCVRRNPSLPWYSGVVGERNCALCGPVPAHSPFNHDSNMPSCAPSPSPWWVETGGNIKSILLPSRPQPNLPLCGTPVASLPMAPLPCPSQAFPSLLPSSGGVERAGGEGLRWRWVGWTGPSLVSEESVEDSGQAGGGDRGRPHSNPHHLLCWPLPLRCQSDGEIWPHSVLGRQEELGNS